jgi:hypothetical protein
MASIAAIRDGLKTRLATITGLYTHDTIPDAVNPPAAIVGMPTTIAYDFTFRAATTRFVFPVRVLVGRAAEAEAQDKLDGYLSADGATSIRAAVDGDGTLGGVANTSRVVEARDLGAYEVGATQYLGAEVMVEVVA